MNAPKFGFTVDTHLFRELGELLVGRDSTALVELIKNAYDADATVVSVRGRDLLRGSGRIEVADDGVGMTPEVFQNAFLRIAGRFKETGSRKSPLYMRQYTGAKGVGRLSAHKLAERLEVASRPRRALEAGEQSVAGVEAFIDWKALEERAQTLDNVGSDALRVHSILATDRPYGTTMTLSSIRGRWTKKKLVDFVQEVSSCLPPDELLDVPDFINSGAEWQLGRISPWTHGQNDPGFRIELSGEFNIGDPLWPKLISRSNWLLEIDAQSDGVRFGIIPTPVEQKRNPHAQSYYLRRDHPDPERGPFFRARVYQREGPITGVGELSDFADKHSGIRMYMEGFRVVPYGDSHDDWLGLNRDYVRRVRGFEQIPLDEWTTDVLPELKTESFKIRGNRQYVGGVFLTAEGGAALRPVVNREGFLQDEVFENLRTLTRNGVDLLIRAQAATSTYRANPEPSRLENGTGRPSANGGSSTEPSVNPPASPPRFEQISEEPRDVAARRNLDVALTKVKYELTQIRSTVSDPEFDRQLDEATAAVDQVKRTAEEDQAEHAMLQVLASVGLQFAAFVHEVNGLLSQAQQIRTLAEALPTSSSSLVKEIRASSDILCQSLARQASYLTEVVGPDARRRRRRVPLSDAPRTSLQLLESAISERGIQVVEELDPYVRTPPIFPAELTIIFTNLLTNAVKATGSGGKILISGLEVDGQGTTFRVENTGQPIDVASAERWFRPFESTTTDVDVLLGQGMGLGLPITRRIVTEYSGSVRFVAPSPGYATAVQFTLPQKKGSQ